MTEQAIEQEIQDKGKTAPRITPDHIDRMIKAEQYHVFDGTQTTVCLLTLQNGFTVTGESACASPENFDAEIGRKIARENAREKIWLLEGYLLKQKLFDRERGYSISLPHDGSPLTSGSVGVDEIDAGLASSNIKRDNSKQLAEKIMILETDGSLTDEQVHALGKEVVELAKGILATCPDPHEEPTV